MSRNWRAWAWFWILGAVRYATLSPVAATTEHANESSVDMGELHNE